MTVEEIRTAIEEIKRDAKRDPEVAHIREDELFEAVLQAVAAGAENAAELAAEALKTKDAEFARWCA